MNAATKLKLEDVPEDLRRMLRNKDEAKTVFFGESAYSLLPMTFLDMKLTEQSLEAMKTAFSGGDDAPADALNGIFEAVAVETLGIDKDDFSHASMKQVLHATGVWAHQNFFGIPESDLNEIVDLISLVMGVFTGKQAMKDLMGEAEKAKTTEQKPE